MTQFTCKGVKQINNRISFKHLYHSYLSAFSSAREFQMGNFQKYWSQNVGQDFIVLDFLLGGYRVGGKGVCGRLMSSAHETQSMQEIRLLRGRLPRKGGGLTGMWRTCCCLYLTDNVSVNYLQVCYTNNL